MGELKKRPRHEPPPEREIGGFGGGGGDSAAGVAGDSRQGGDPSGGAARAAADRAARAMAGRSTGGAGGSDGVAARGVATAGPLGAEPLTVGVVEAQSPDAAAKPGPGSAGGTDKREPTDAERWSEIERTLGPSALGQEALARFKKYAVGLVWADGTGSSYSTSGNSMTIDRKESLQSAAFAFVHEMNHAYYFHESLSADAKVTAMTRAAFIDAEIDEEAEGTALAIESLMEVEEATQTCLVARFPLEKEYRVACQAARDGGAGVGAARMAGRAAVKKGFVDGKVTTDTSGETYTAYYGRWWDRANRGKTR